MAMLPEDPETGYAISSADLLADFLTDNDANDPDAGDPAEWPSEYDSIRVAIGPAFFRG